MAAVAMSYEMVSDASGSWAKITITEDGKPKDLYVAMPTSESSGSTLNIPFNNRGYFSLTPTLDPSQFYKPNLLGGSFEYTVDMSQSNCGCISTIYMVSMPGKDSSGNYWNTDGYYYCDANQVGGNYCPEFDLIEANQFTAQTTPHSCNSPSSAGFYDYCNRSGSCWQNTKNNLAYSDYGPGDSYKINTLKEFTGRVDFHNNGQFDSFTVTYMQDGKSVSMNTGDCEETKKMTNDIRNGMAFAFSSWETMDNWLWGDRCQASSCNSHNLYFKNMKVVTGGDSPQPPTPPSPSGDYVYGDACANKSSDDCDGSCDCFWSWPSSESWDGPDAHCRCKAAPGPTPGNFNYGDTCSTPYDDDCTGCNCHWSWPSNESWDGPDAHCRCM
jgi:hypothetical protein